MFSLIYYVDNQTQHEVDQLGKKIKENLVIIFIFLNLKIH